MHNFKFFLFVEIWKNHLFRSRADKKLCVTYLFYFSNFVFRSARWKEFHWGKLVLKCIQSEYIQAERTFNLIKLNLIQQCAPKWRLNSFLLDHKFKLYVQLWINLKKHFFSSAYLILQNFKIASWGRSFLAEIYWNCFLLMRGEKNIMKQNLLCCERASERARC